MSAKDLLSQKLAHERDQVTTAIDSLQEILDVQPLDLGDAYASLLIGQLTLMREYRETLHQWIEFLAPPKP